MAPLAAKKRENTFRQAPWLTLPNLTGGTTALKLRVHLSPSKYPRATLVREILSPSLGARIKIFGRAAPRNTRAPAAMAPAFSRLEEKRPAGKTPSPRGLTQFVAAALPNISIRAPKLGDRISITGVARGYMEGLRCTRSFGAVAPPVRFGRVSQGACLKVFSRFLAANGAAGARASYGGGAPKSPCARP